MLRNSAAVPTRRATAILPTIASLRRRRAAVPAADIGSTFSYRPTFAVAVAFGVTWLGFFLLGGDTGGSQTFVAWYASVVWTIPGGLSVLGFSGALRMRRLRPFDGASRMAAEPAQPVGQRLVVVVPTVGRADSLPALRRIVDSFIAHLPARFDDLRVDLVVEEECEMRSTIEDLAAESSDVRVVVIPSQYVTPNRTPFKARANQFAMEERRRRQEARADVWVLHMDDDTGIADDTARATARFIAGQTGAGDDASYLAQGLLVYPRELASSRVAWMADAIRPACDASLFVRSTSRGSPRAGLHGELLLVRADIEDGIGWDYGPRAIVEDADFALRFCERHPGRSGWLEGRSLGASPARVVDLLQQRERWVWGLLEMLASSPVGLRHRLLLSAYVLVWTLSPFGHPLVVGAIALSAGQLGPRPVLAVLALVWAINVSYSAWLYWEGMRINRASSRPGTTSWHDQVLVLVAAPLLTLLECIGVLRGVARFARRGTCDFHVIAKPR